MLDVSMELFHSPRRSLSSNTSQISDQRLFPLLSVLLALLATCGMQSMTTWSLLFQQISRCWSSQKGHLLLGCQSNYFHPLEPLWRLTLSYLLNSWLNAQTDCWCSLRNSWLWIFESILRHECRPSSNWYKHVTTYHTTHSLLKILRRYEYKIQKHITIKFVCKCFITLKVVKNKKTKLISQTHQLNIKVSNPCELVPTWKVPGNCRLVLTLPYSRKSIENRIKVP